jgi:hypothetical protein
MGIDIAFYVSGSNAILADSAAAVSLMLSDSCKSGVEAIGIAFTKR